MRDTLFTDDNLISEPGGLSGPMLKPVTLGMVKKVRQYTKGTLPIIASGGVCSAEDALDYARSGASAVQLYTSLIYEGPGIATKLKCDLAKILKENNTTWKEVTSSSLQ